ncbi:MAG: glycosyltransferase family 39 protein [Polyangiaceae bacterium]|nr:glycosyltransferase family 39 protein [Polyangiaceae bacterium]
MKRRHIASGVLGVCAFLGGWLQLPLFSFGRDQSIYALVGEGLLHGKLPYRDLWDFKPPGIFFAYGLAQALFGKTMLAPRILEMAGMAVLALSFVFLAQRWVGSVLVGVWSAALAMFVHSQLDFWHTAQPETFGAVLTVLGLALMVHSQSARWPWVYWVALGIAFGVAGLMKPHLVAGGVVLAAFLAAERYLQRRSFWQSCFPVLAVGAGSLLPILVTGFWFWAKGAWPALSWTLFEFAPGYTALTYHNATSLRLFYSAIEEGCFRFSAIVAVGLVLAFALPAQHRREREGLFLLVGICCVHFSGIAMQSKFYQYHFSATLPLLCFIAVVGLAKLWRRTLLWGPRGALAFCSALGLLALMRVATNDTPLGYWARASERLRFLVSASSFPNREALDTGLYRVGGFNLADNQQIAARVAKLSRPSDTVFVWGFEPSIYWFSERSPASRFIYNVPQRASWQGAEAQASLMRDLERTRPQVLVVQRGDIIPSVVGNNLDSDHFLTEFPALSQFVTHHYLQTYGTARFDVYQRVPGIGTLSAAPIRSLSGTNPG